jgi:hypothetical protein
MLVPVLVLVVREACLCHVHYGVLRAPVPWGEEAMDVDERAFLVRSTSLFAAAAGCGSP